MPGLCLLAAIGLFHAARRQPRLLAAWLVGTAPLVLTLWSSIWNTRAVHGGPLSGPHPRRRLRPGGVDPLKEHGNGRRSRSLQATTGRGRDQPWPSPSTTRGGGSGAMRRKPASDPRELGKRRSIACRETTGDIEVGAQDAGVELAARLTARPSNGVCLPIPPPEPDLERGRGK